jgi:cell fate regulator YaaT (PSP1 superfamily)
MSIFPLPVFEADADPDHRDAKTDAEMIAALKPPKTIVVRFGRMRNVGEYVYRGDATPGCGTKLVARTHRGTELVEMLTTTCDNSGCSKSVSRKEMREYITNSGGNDFPFYSNGKVLRVATVEDLNKQSALRNDHRYVKACKAAIEKYELPMKLGDVEPVLGEELLTFYYMSEDRVDFRDVVKDLAAEFKSRIEMRQVGARDEARLVADYERCGQHCCCKNFLKVLRPVSMKAAKLQKATLDPLKISGRCGRLMCCLRYEDESYRELKKKLPHKKTRVGTPEGPGLVIDGRILVQLVLVRLEHDGRQIAVPVEELMDPEKCPPPGSIPAPDPFRGASPDKVRKRVERDARRGGKRDDEGSGEQQPATKSKSRGRRRGKSQDEATVRAEGGGDTTDAPEARKPRKKRGRRGRGRTKAEQQDAFRDRSQAEDAGTATEPRADDGSSSTADGKATGGDKKKRRRRRRGRGGSGGQDGAGGAASGSSSGGDQAAEGGAPKKKRRRRKRRKPGGGDGDGGQSESS